MKKLSPTELDRTAIVVKCGDLWEVRVFNRVTGDAPIGARLGRASGMPDIPTKASTRMEAEQHRERWQVWMDEQPQRKWRKR